MTISTSSHPSTYEIPQPPSPSSEQRSEGLDPDPEIGLEHYRNVEPLTPATRLLSNLFLRRGRWIQSLLMSLSTAKSSLLRRVADTIAVIFILTRTRLSLVQLGWMRASSGMPVLAGVVTYRILVHSRHDLTEARVLPDGSTNAIATATPVLFDSVGPAKIWAVNVWVDTARLPSGRQKLHMSVYAGRRHVGHIRRFVFVHSVEAVAPNLSWLEKSDSFVPSPAVPTEDEDTTSYVLSLPVRKHRPATRIFPDPIRSILLLRTDQLGDVSASLPTMMQLRRLFPEARITVLSQKVPQTIIRASGLADEFLDITLGYDARTEHRFLTECAERELRYQLRGREFDLAIDLAPGSESQPLMLLCNARYRVGFKPEQFPFLDFGIEVISRDKVNRKSVLSHAAHVRMLVSTLENALLLQQGIIPRLAAQTADISLLAQHGLTSRQYVVVHSGARHPINRWPLSSFLSLVRHITEKTGLFTLLFVDEDDLSEAVRQECAPLTKVRLMTSLKTDDFDAILSHARLAVTNDTGPKHLAATRGVPVISISIPRLNWQEWGQNRGGMTLSRQMPCAGCSLNDRKACARDAICVTSIPVNEVLDSVLIELAL